MVENQHSQSEPQHSALPDANEAIINDGVTNIVPQSNLTEDTMFQVAELLGELEEVGRSPKEQAKVIANQNLLINARLGVASSLFTALRARHDATASHCLRVALSCSSWAIASGFAARSMRKHRVCCLTSRYWKNRRARYGFIKTSFFDD